MRYVVVFLSAFAVGVAGLTAWPTPSDNFQGECLDTFVSVEVPGGLGSGVLLDGSRVLTAGHVVRNSREAARRKPHLFGQEYRAEDIKVIRTERGVRHEYTVAHIVDVDHGSDLALLQLEATNLPAIAGLADSIRTGEPCWYVGNPGGLRMLAEGSIISALDFRVQDGRRRTVTGGMGWYGNSGGPLFVKRGKHYVLAGICLSGWPDMPKSPVAFARPEDIKSFGGL